MRVSGSGSAPARVRCHGRAGSRELAPSSRAVGVSLRALLADAQSGPQVADVVWTARRIVSILVRF